MSTQYRVKHYTTYPARGGAGIAALRLVRGLCRRGHRATLIGLAGEEAVPEIRSIVYSRSPLANIRRRVRSGQISRIPDGYAGLSRQGAAFFTDRSAHGVAMADTFAGADILHFHWVADLIDYADTLSRLPAGIPVVWTLHDMGAFTGGCTYSLGCEGFLSGCEDCPQLLESGARAEARRSFKRREDAVSRNLENLTIVTPSAWLGAEAGRSRMLGGYPREVIHNGYDLGLFKPERRAAGRSRIGAGENEVVLLFAAASVDNPVKGMNFLLEVLPPLEKKYAGLRVAYVGNCHPDSFPSRWQWLGSHSDESVLAEIYAGADLLLLPSLADNFPNVIGEALSAGTPVAGSRVGGVPEMIVHGETGFHLEPRDVSCWSRCLSRFIEYTPGQAEAMRNACRRYAEESLSLEASVSRHEELYRRVCRARTDRS